jgi:hypothetical protein
MVDTGQAIERSVQSLKKLNELAEYDASAGGHADD